MVLFFVRIYNLFFVVYLLIEKKVFCGLKVDINIQKIQEKFFFW